MVLFSSTIISCGCISIPPAPTIFEMDNADYGAKPNAKVIEDLEETVRISDSVTLKDPESAIYAFSPAPIKGWFRGKGEKVRYAWKISYTVNAKNSYGGYTGSKVHWRWYRGDAMVGLGWFHDEYGKLEAELESYDWGDSEQSP